MEFAREIVEDRNSHLLVLDEINLAVHCDLLETKEVLNLLDKISKEMNVFLTGRHASEELVDRADSVVEVKDVKSPEDMLTTEGIQY